MKRDYTSSNNVTGVTYFVGTEIEHTPAFGKKTLFVVGIQDADEIIEMASNNDTKRNIKSGMFASKILPTNNFILSQLKFDLE